MFKLFKKQDKKVAELLSTSIEKVKQEAYEDGFKFGLTEAKKEFEIMLQKKALDLYTNQNWLINPNHIFQVTKTNIPYLGMEPIKKEKLKNLQSQANALLGFELWEILTTMIRQKAIEQSLKTSTEWNHVIPGKMMVHNIALMETLVKYIAEVEVDKIPDTSGGQSKDIH